MFQFAPWPYLLGQVSREIVVEPRVFSRKNKQEAACLESNESKKKKHIFYEQTGLYVAFFLIPSNSHAGKKVIYQHLSHKFLRPLEKKNESNEIVTLVWEV